MLCVAAQAAPQGYLAHAGEALAAADIARIAGLGEGEAAALLGELERNGVFSRDRRGRIYSRRMVRDLKLRKSARQTGRRGGNPSLCSAGEISSTLKGRDKGGVKAPLGPISQKPESRSQQPEETAAPGRIANGPGGALVLRAAAAMGVAPERLLRKPAWIVFGDMMADLKAQGCDAERDAWPTIERLSARLKGPPASPAYFRAAILEARDERTARGGAHMGGDAQEWADRLAVFAADGAWSSRWGPKPGEAGCLVPDDAAAGER